MKNTPHKRTQWS